MRNPYVPKYLKEEPTPLKPVQDTALAMVERNRARIMDEELTAMVRRNPNRRVAEDARKPAPAEEAPTDSGNFVAGILLTAVIVLLILITNVAIAL